MKFNRILKKVVLIGDIERLITPELEIKIAKTVMEF